MESTSERTLGMETMGLGFMKSRRRVLLLAAVIVVIASCSLVFSALVRTKTSLVQTETSLIQTKTIGTVMKPFAMYPSCPESLSGVLTAPLMDPDNISALIPLGNLNPSGGHAAPTDHIYFQTNDVGLIRAYAPADSWITQISVEYTLDNRSRSYAVTGYVITYTVCDGLVLILAGYVDVAPEIKALLSGEWSQGCQYGVVKHGTVQGFCGYSPNYRVKAGQLVGWVQKKANGDLPFEVWADNYNVAPRSDVNWGYYDSRTAHIICLFDLYSGQLRDAYYSKFGVVRDGTFIARTIEPRCGQVVQDIVGRIQGMWFDGPPQGVDVGFIGGVVGFLHDNIDPTKGVISVYGGIMSDSNSGVIVFVPAHSGRVNREPSEVGADGQVYCYSGSGNTGSYPGSWGVPGKILVQLIDDHHIRVEYQDGDCGGSYSFVNPYTYQR
jgi:hypothetical protein